MLAIEDRRFYDHPGVDFIRSVGAIVTNLRGDQRLSGRRQHHHAAAGEELLSLAREVDAAQADGAGHGARARAPRDQGRDSRALSERHPARPARVVRHPRRVGSRSSLLRQGHQQSLAGGGGDHRGRHPVAVGALAVQQPARCRDRRNVVLQAMATPVTSARRPRTRPPGAARRSCSARSRPKRRTSSTTSAQTLERRLPGPDDHDATARWMSTRRSICICSGWRSTRCATAWPTSINCSSRRKRKGRAEAALLAVDPQDGRNPRDGRRPLLQPVPVQPRRRGAPAARVGLQAVRLPDGVRASRRRRRTGGLTPASIVDDSPTDLGIRRSGLDARRTTKRTTTVRSRCGGPSPTRATSRRSRSPSRAGYDRVAALWRKLGVGTPAEGLSLDRARRLRGHAARDRDRVHDLSQPGRRAAAAHICSASSAARRT